MAALKPLRIALSGGIASGKSLVCTEFSALGVPVIDADEISHALWALGTPSRAALEQLFGADLSGKSAQAARAQARKQVFADEQLRKRLEELMHPQIQAEMEQRGSHIDAPYCLFCIPLLVETHTQEAYDRVLIVDAPTALQLRRLMVRDSYSQKLAERIIAAQCSRETRLAAADDILRNDRAGSEHLRTEILTLHKLYTRLAKQGRQGS
ncbi:MAG: dephospho-CoA kinase [Candidatus Eutrophobiaceae bacterium]